MFKTLQSKLYGKLIRGGKVDKAQQEIMTETMKVSGESHQ